MHLEFDIKAQWKAKQFWGFLKIKKLFFLFIITQ